MIAKAMFWLSLMGHAILNQDRSCLCDRSGPGETKTPSSKHGSILLAEMEAIMMALEFIVTELINSCSKHLLPRYSVTSSQLWYPEVKLV